jgi:CheY-like chemotaxis protein
MNESNNNEVNILMADDDPDDRMFFADAIVSLPVRINLTTVKDGARLMQLLLQPETVLPDILFLDLNMPFRNGFECLVEIRNHSRLKNIFIAIYSTTSNPREVEETFSKGANLFVHKPNTFTELKTTLAKVFKLDLKEYSHPEKEKFVLDTYC